MDENADIIDETTAQDGTEFRVILVPDQDAQNPREEHGTHVGVIHVVSQTRYDVPQESDIPGLATKINDHDFKIIAQWLRMFHGATVVLPIYSTGGRDFAIGAGTADETPQAGDYVGVTFDTPDSRKGCGFGPLDTRRTYVALHADVLTYAQWAAGDVYGYVVETGPGADDIEIPDASCWGFIGREWAEQAAREALDQAVAAYDEQTAQDAAEDDAAHVAEIGGWLI